MMRILASMLLLLFGLLSPPGKSVRPGTVPRKQSPVPSATPFLGRDDRTQGNWTGVYGAEAFLAPVWNGLSIMKVPGLDLHRGIRMTTARPDPVPGPTDEISEAQQGWAPFVHSRTSVDPRVPYHVPGLKERMPVYFRTVGVPLYVEVEAEDGKAHQLSLYLLDFHRTGSVFKIELLDAHRHVLDTRRLDRFGGGSYLRYRVKGTRIVRITPLTGHEATLSGAFLDPITQ